MTDRDALEADIAAHRFFAGVPAPLVGAVAAIARRARHVPGAAICHEGSAADALVLVLRGSARLSLHVPARGEVTLETVGAGDVIGWSWAVAPHRWAFSAVATEPLDAIHIDGQALRTACANHHELGYHVHARLVAVLADRLRHTRVRLLDVYGAR